MKDAIGQEIQPGNFVLWGGGKTQYAGLPLFKVRKLTDKRVTCLRVEYRERRALDPLNLVVVDKLLDPAVIEANKKLGVD